MEEENKEEETSEETPEEEETSEETKEKAAEGKEPDWKAKADAMYAKYKDAKETIGELEGKLSKLEKPKKEVSQDEWKSKVDFLMGNKDFSEEEFNHIATVSKEFDVSLEEAAELEKDYIQYRREKVAKEKKVPAPSSPSSESKELSSEEIGKMSKDEHRKLWEVDLKSREGSEGI